MAVGAGPAAFPLPCSRTPTRHGRGRHGDQARRRRRHPRRLCPAGGAAQQGRGLGRTAEQGACGAARGARMATCGGAMARAGRRAAFPAGGGQPAARRRGPTNREGRRRQGARQRCGAPRRGGQRLRARWRSAPTAARRRSGDGGARFEREGGRGGRAACGDAHHELGSIGERPEERARRRGRRSARMAMAAGAQEVDSAGERLKSSSRRVVDLRGEARELGREGFAVGRRGTAGATSSARLVVHASSKEEERRLTGKLPGRPRGEERRRGVMANAWRLAAGHSRRYGVARAE